MTGRERFLVGLLVFLVIAVGWFYAVLPSYRSFESQEQTIKENVREIRRIQARLQRVPRLRHELDSLRSGLRGHVSKISSETERFDLLQNIRKRVRTAGISRPRVIQFEPGETRTVRSPDDDPLPIRVMEVRVRLDAVRWKNLLNLFRNLNHTQPTLSFRQLRIQSDQKRLERFDVQFRLNVFFSTSFPTKKESD